MSEPQRNVNPSLQKKTAARTAAVQCLYQKALTGDKTSPEKQLAGLKKRLANNREEQKIVVGLPIEPNYTLLEALLLGTEQWKEDIDKRLDLILDSDWKRERMSPLIIAILQCAIFELFFHKDAAPTIVIDEYSRLTRSFFADADVDFVHAAPA